MINRIHHPFQVLPSLDPSLLRQHHHDTSMRGNRQTSSTPANVFPMDAFQSQVNVHLLSNQPDSAGGKAVTPYLIHHWLFRIEYTWIYYNRRSQATRPAFSILLPTALMV
jgi:hypothetical protein